MRIRIQCQTDLGIPQPFLDNLRMLARFQQQRSRCMPKIVKPETWKSRSLQQWTPGLPQKVTLALTRCPQTISLVTAMNAFTMRVERKLNEIER